MEEDIDIEEHDVLDNPAIRKVFPDISEIKKEIQYYEQGIKVEVNIESLSYDYDECVQESSGKDTIFGMFGNTEDYNEDINKSSLIQTKRLSTSAFLEPMNSNKIILGTKPANTTVDFEEFETEMSLNRSNIVIHDSKSYLENSDRYCAICLILFPAKNSLLDHKYIFHIKQLRKVRKKLFKNTANINYLNIKQNWNGIKTYGRKSKKRRGENVTHEKDYEEISKQDQCLKQFYRCHVCTVYFECMEMCLRHMALDHSILQHSHNIKKSMFNSKCNFCPRSFASFQEFNFHIHRIHINMYRKKCSDFKTIHKFDERLLDSSISVKNRTKKYHLFEEDSLLTVSYEDVLNLDIENSLTQCRTDTSYHKDSLNRATNSLNRYCCVVCQRFFDKPLGLVNHFKFKHVKRRRKAINNGISKYFCYRCNICLEYFRFPVSFICHLASVHSITQYSKMPEKVKFDTLSKESFDVDSSESKLNKQMDKDLVQDESERSTLNNIQTSYNKLEIYLQRADTSVHNITRYSKMPKNNVFDLVSNESSGVDCTIPLHNEHSKKRSDLQAINVFDERLHDSSISVKNRIKKCHLFEEDSLFTVSNADVLNLDIENSLTQHRTDTSYHEDSSNRATNSLNRYCCVVCQRFFDKPLGLVNHFKFKHVKRRRKAINNGISKYFCYRCHICLEYFRFPVAFIYHLASVHNITQYSKMPEKVKCDTLSKESFDVDSSEPKLNKQMDKDLVQDESERSTLNNIQTSYDKLEIDLKRTDTSLHNITRYSKMPKNNEFDPVSNESSGVDCTIPLNNVHSKKCSDIQAINVSDERLYDSSTSVKNRIKKCNLSEEDSLFTVSNADVLNLDIENSLTQHRTDTSYHEDSLNRATNSLNRYCCVVCQRFFDKPMGLVKHLQIKHVRRGRKAINDGNSKICYRCHICLEYFRFPVSFIYHLASVHSITQYSKMPKKVKFDPFSKESSDFDSSELKLNKQMNKDLIQDESERSTLNNIQTSYNKLEINLKSIDKSGHKITRYSKMPKNNEFDPVSNESSDTGCPIPLHNEHIKKCSDLQTINKFDERNVSKMYLKNPIKNCLVYDEDSLSTNSNKDILKLDIGNSLNQRRADNSYHEDSSNKTTNTLNPYCCNVCQRFFDNPLGLITHLKFKHGGRGSKAINYGNSKYFCYRCNICLEYFRFPVSFICHLASVHNITRYSKMPKKVRFNPLSQKNSDVDSSELNKQISNDLIQDGTKISAFKNIQTCHDKLEIHLKRTDTGEHNVTRYSEIPKNDELECDPVPNESSDIDCTILTHNQHIMQQRSELKKQINHDLIQEESERSALNNIQTPYDKVEINLKGSDTKSVMLSNDHYYKCIICSYYSHDLMFYTEHLARNHGITEGFDMPDTVKFDPVCKFCFRIQPNPRTYNSHLIMYHKENTVNTNIDVNRQKHINIYDSDQTTKVPKVNTEMNIIEIISSTKNVEPGINDVQILLKSIIFKCIKCDIHFLTAKKATDHLDHMELLVNWKCTNCKKIFKKEDGLLHELQHDLWQELKVYDLYPDSGSRLLYKCLKCAVHFNEDNFIKHYMDCDNPTTSVYCRFCDILVADAISKSHKVSHVHENLKYSDFIFVEANVEAYHHNKVTESREKSNSFDNNQIIGKHISNSSFVENDKFHDYSKKELINSDQKNTNMPIKEVNSMTTNYLSEIVSPLKIIYYCKCCRINVDTYDKVVEHCQEHYALKENRIDTVSCRICDLTFDKTCYENHKKLHGSSDRFHVLGFDFLYFTSESKTWLKHVFGNMNRNYINKIMRDSIYKPEHRIKMEVVQYGPPNLTVYKCDTCGSYIDELNLYKHAENSCFKSRKHHCTSCDLPFISSIARIKHEKIHEKHNILANAYRVVYFNKEEHKDFNKLIYHRSNYYVLYQCRNCSGVVDKSQISEHKCIRRILRKCSECGLLIGFDDQESHSLRHQELENFTKKNMKVILFGESCGSTEVEEEFLDAVSSCNENIYDYTLYSCASCQMCTNTYENTLKHKCTSGKLKLKCPNCNLYFSMTDLKMHCKLHDTDLDFVRENMKIIIFESLKTEQIINMYKCNCCGVHFFEHGGLVSHKKTCFPMDWVLKEKCCKCDLLFTPNVLFHHMVLHHSDKNFKFNIVETC